MNSAAALIWMTSHQNPSFAEPLFDLLAFNVHQALFTGKNVDRKGNNTK
jgi:hypothetical protein